MQLVKIAEDKKNLASNAHISQFYNGKNYKEIGAISFSQREKKDWVFLCGGITNSLINLSSFPLTFTFYQNSFISQKLREINHFIVS